MLIESPLNRLLNVTIPELVSGQLTREESRRRFDKQLELENRDRQDRIDRENQNRIRQDELLAEERRQFNENASIQRTRNKLTEERLNREELSTRTTNYLSSLSDENDIQTSINRLETAKKSSNLDNTVLDSEINRLKSVQQQQQDDLEFYRDSGVLNEQSSSTLERMVGKKNFNDTFNKFYMLALENKDTTQKQNLEILKIEYDSNARRIRELDKIAGSGLPGSEEASKEISSLIQRNQNLISGYRGSPPPPVDSGTGINIKEQIKKVKTNTGGNVSLSMIKELNDLPTDASIEVVQSVFSKYGVTDANDQAEIINALETQEAALDTQVTNRVQRPTSPGLTEQQQAGLQRVRQLGDTSEVVDFLQSLLRPVAEAGQRAGEAIRNIPAPRGNMYRPAG